MPRDMNTLTLAAVIPFLVAVATACGTSTPEPGPTSPPRQVVVLPFDGYHLSAQDRATVDAAQNMLMRDCMAAKGFAWTRPQAPVGEPVLIAGNARRYGLTDSKTAQRYGYHVPTEPRRARALAEEAAWADRLSKDERHALFDPDGCTDQAVSVLREGTGDRDTSWFTRLGHAAVDHSVEAAVVISATTAWRHCMRESDFDYRTPQDALEDPRWNLDSPRISPTERAVATADVQCKERTDYIAARAAAEQKIQSEMIQRNATRFDALKKSNQRYRRNAHDVLHHE